MQIGPFYPLILLKLLLNNKTINKPNKIIVYEICIKNRLYNATQNAYHTIRSFWGVTIDPLKNMKNQVNLKPVENIKETIQSKCSNIITGNVFDLKMHKF